MALGKVEICGVNTLRFQFLNLPSLFLVAS